MSRRSIEVEHSLLEVGAEVYRLKHEITRILEMQERFTKSMRGLKDLLDEKGVVTTEDFEAAVDMVEFMGHNSTRQETTSAPAADSDWRKKPSH